MGQNRENGKYMITLSETQNHFVPDKDYRVKYIIHSNIRPLNEKKNKTKNNWGNCY